MYIVTFYSFKGGVGRTLALVNVAAELARRGRNVLLVDFDLEAPGLHTYELLQPAKPHAGIVEYVTEYRQNYQRNGSVPNLAEYIYEAKQYETMRQQESGHMWVMPAGKCNHAYRAALANLDWLKLYKEEEGFVLFEDTRAGWADGWGNEFKPDYVLIDSRTGYSDVLGICTRQLADSVVLMFTPNEQNLEGIDEVYRDIRREENEGLKKTIRTHFVAANVPYDHEHGVVQRQIDLFMSKFRPHDLATTIRRYESPMLLNQRIDVLDRRDSELSQSYYSLVASIVKGENPEDYAEVLNRLKRAMMDAVEHWRDENEGKYRGVDLFEAIVEAGDFVVNTEHRHMDDPRAQDSF